MDPDPVVQLAYERATSSPWPGIVRILSLLALLYGAASATSSATSLWNVLHPKPNVNYTYFGGYTVHFVTLIAYTAAGLILTIASVACLAQRDWRAVLMVGALLFIMSIATKAVAEALTLSFQPPSYVTSMDMAEKFLWYAQVFGYILTAALFPMALLLIFFRYRQDPQLAAVFHRGARHVA